MGRVRVKFPALGDTVESAWARVASPGAGKDRGMMFLPDVGDEVVVAFEHGDTRRPVVLGALYNAKDSRPARCSATSRAAAPSSVHTPQGRRVQAREAVRHRRQGPRWRSRSRAATRARATSSIKTADSFEIDAKQTLNVKAGSTITFEGTGEIKIKSSAAIIVEARVSSSSRAPWWTSRAPAG